MGYPEPELGLVISYSYLWSEEAAAGHAEGRKTRPCAILLVIQQPEGEPPRVTVAPITHSPPHDSGVAIEIPTRVKRHLGLDSERSWVDRTSGYGARSSNSFRLLSIPGRKQRRTALRAIRIPRCRRACCRRAPRACAGSSTCLVGRVRAGQSGFIHDHDRETQPIQDLKQTSTTYIRVAVLESREEIDRDPRRGRQHRRCASHWRGAVLGRCGRDPTAN